MMQDRACHGAVAGLAIHFTLPAIPVLNKACTWGSGLPAGQSHRPCCCTQRFLFSAPGLSQAVPGIWAMSRGCTPAGKPGLVM